MTYKKPKNQLWHSAAPRVAGNRRYFAFATRRVECGAALAGSLHSVPAAGAKTYSVSVEPRAARRTRLPLRLARSNLRPHSGPYYPPMSGAHLHISLTMVYARGVRRFTFSTQDTRLSLASLDRVSVSLDTLPRSGARRQPGREDLGGAGQGGAKPGAREEESH